jgi:FkbM family methyltransferase
MKTYKIAIIDKLGLCYDGNTLSKQGLGGSESAVILIAKHLQQIGFDVTVFNNCIDSKHSKPGVYDGVRYIDNADAQSHVEDYDIVISSRSILPFTSSDYPFIQRAPCKKILWLHDTFIEGDHIVEDLMISGKIDYIFTLSDWHSTYILNATHGPKRNFEVLKKRIFQTRNGAVCHIDEVDLSAKDRNHFVYNASATKGMIPLLEDIWPRIKAQLPQAHLTVIGGYYRFREGAEPDAQENTVAALAKRQDLKDLDVTFTGVIPQHEIAQILANAWMTLYPGAFPETFGISTLESLLYKTPLVTTRFGALEETAVEGACYHIDYAIEPNVLFPHIDKQQQIQRFIAKFFEAYSTPYLHQQKQNYCDVVKDIAGWDTVALQWKQFFYNIMDEFLSVDDYRTVTRINDKVARVFGRTATMPVTHTYQSFGPQRRIVIVSPFYNAAEYIKKHIQSVASQDYDNYLHILIDDASTDGCAEIAQNILDSLSNSLRGNFVLLRNSVNKGSICNQLQAIKAYSSPDDIVILLDGDDWLVNNNSIFHYYNDLYAQGYEFTYGSMWSLADSIPLIAQEYPAEIKYTKTYRSHLFNWRIPYTHLRTCAAKYFLTIDDAKFKINNQWMKAGADNPLFYELIEQIEPSAIYCNREIVAVYNDINPLNDYKVRSDEQNRNADLSYKGLYSVVVPTMWKANNTFIPFLCELVRHPRVGEIILINNDNTKTPNDSVLNHSKIRHYDFEKNIYVNPAWNFGVTVSSNNKLCIVNDDLAFDTKLFDAVEEFIKPEHGVIGLCPGISQFNQPPYSDGSITIKEWAGEHTYGFGCLMFIHKDSWNAIPKGLDIYFGDNFIFDTNLRKGKKNFIITNIQHSTAFAQTTSDISITGGFLEREQVIYSTIMKPKRILVAIPTNRYIEPETFKSLWDLKVPEGYELDFQYFYGYCIDQIRNLIGDWAKRYDYLFSVDADIIVPQDALVKMIAADKDIISGLYIQRIDNTHTLEVYMVKPDGGVTNIPYDLIKHRGIVEIAACGMGCALIKSEVFRKLPYPHFVYKSALTMAQTVSEDVYFCLKARDDNFKVWADSSIRCEHKGSTYFKVAAELHLDIIAQQNLLPAVHSEYLKRMNINPAVIYDIGACVQHWTREACTAWPEAQFYLIDAAQSVERFLADKPYAIAVLSDQDGKLLDFYEDRNNPGGNSYYLETTGAFNESHKTRRTAITLDTLVLQNNWPLPDLIKLDVQGAELDILKGAVHTLSRCNDIILEAQHVEYNLNAPRFNEVKSYLESIGFKLVACICKNQHDGDYHFTRQL